MGVVTVVMNLFGKEGNTAFLGPVPVYNMVPPPGVPAAFGLNVLGNLVSLRAHVRTDGDYGLTVTASDISEGLAIIGNSVSFWGVPASPSHDSERACAGQPNPNIEPGATCAVNGPLKAFLRNPTSCSPAGQGLAYTIETDSWPGVFDKRTIQSHLQPAFPADPAEWGPAQGTTGCASVPFTPTLSVSPQAPIEAASPDGLLLDVSMPQTTDPTVPAQADLRRTVLTFPEGMTLSPSSAAGLGACSEAQIGFVGSGFPEPNPTHFTTAPAVCPDSSRLGTVSLETPLLKEPLTGALYLATPHENPFGSLVAVYLVAEGSGVTVKLPGRVDLNPLTGQVTATFDDTPQLPFSRLHVALKSGPRSAFSMPARCGTYTTHAVLTSWSGKTVSSDSSFRVTEGPSGGPCAPASFAPSFTAGATNPLAGAFSPFALRLLRSDGESGLGQLQTLTLPPGLLADVASVPVRCTEAQALAASCPAASRIGGLQTGAGSGPNPFYVPGDVYLMGKQTEGPFRGDPFGLAVVVHAVAGPFDLGYVVVKGGIQINDDGSVTTRTEPFPQILQGIPLDLRDVRVSLDRPNFMINPTDCEPMAIGGLVSSTSGQSANLSSRFQVADCASLKFKPTFAASTAGSTSKANGASFHVHLASNEGPHTPTGADESNIAKVDVQLPVSLPARLTTLQKACTAAQFASDPAGCPAASFVGSAIAHTPILASPLSGPAILVSHGGEAFPDLVLVLQGEGVRLNLTGHTQIKNGITYSRFETVPDAPVSSFDLTLPQGPHSALTTDVPGRNLCLTTRTVTVTKHVTRRVHGHTRRVKVKAKKAVSASLLMPTTITAQNGAVIHQNTKIAVTGCAKRKVAKHAAKGKRR